MSAPNSNELAAQLNSDAGPSRSVGENSNSSPAFNKVPFGQDGEIPTQPRNTSHVNRRDGGETGRFSRGLPSHIKVNDNAVLKLRGSIVSAIPSAPITHDPNNPLPARLQKLISSLPAPPTVPFSSPMGNRELNLKKLSALFAMSLADFYNVPEHCSECGHLEAPSSSATVGRIIERTVKQRSGKRKPKRKRKKRIAKDLDDQAQLDRAIRMSLEDTADKDFKRAIELSRMAQVMEESALDMGFQDQDQDPSMTKALYSQSATDEGCLAEQMGTSAPKLVSLALPTLHITTLPDFEAKEFATSKMNAVSPSLAVANTAGPAGPAGPPPIPGPPLRLKAFPLEVRKHIYKYLFVIRPNAYALTSPRTRRELRLRPHIPSSDTAIFLVDVQLSEETRAVFYTHNIFTIGCGRHGAFDESNLHGLEEFVKLVPRPFRRMIQNIKLEINLNKGWLSDRYSGGVRDCEERHLQAKLIGLGKLMRKKLKGVVNLWVEIRTGDYPLGDLVAWRQKRPIHIAEKLDALRGLIQLPKLHNFYVRNVGSLLVKAALLDMAQEIVDENDTAAAGGQLEEDDERGQVIEVGWIEDEVVTGDVVATGDLMGESRMQEGTGTLPVVLSDDMMDIWVDPYAEYTGHL